ncbi:hypothetical protein ACH49M_12465 [Rhodococcus qingshengii]|nr:hypothetical protein [Rhodococcus erythropolis]
MDRQKFVNEHNYEISGRTEGSQARGSTSACQKSIKAVDLDWPKTAD